MKDMVLWNIEIPEHGIEAKFILKENNTFELEVLAYHDLIELKFDREKLFAFRDALDIALQMTT